MTDWGVTITEGSTAPAIAHVLSAGSPGVPTHTEAGWSILVACRCGRWTQRVGPYGTELLARRVAHGAHRRHAKAAARGIVTVAGWPEEPEQVADPDDERAFLAETAGYVGHPPVLGTLAPIDDDGWHRPFTPVITREVELHPATLRDLEKYGELVPA